MRLKREQVTYLARQIGENLKKVGVKIKVEEGSFFGKIEAVIQKNIDEEQAIEEAVKKLMEQYRSQIATGSVDPQKVYQMMKKQVAKERKFVL